DVANADDAQAPALRKDRYNAWTEALAAGGTAAARPEQKWLVLHSPPWVSYRCAAAPCNTSSTGADPLEAIRAWLRGAGSGIDLMLGGDTHMFQFFVPDKPAIPPQIVAGMSGDLLEPAANFGDVVLDKAIDAKLFDVDGRLWLHHGFGFLMLRKGDAGWTGMLHDAAGNPKLRCALDRPTLDNAPPT